MFDKDKMRRDMRNRAWRRKVEHIFRDENHFFTMKDWEINEFWEPEDGIKNCICETFGEDI